jgi:XTP/dITP diphosphohydrolase
LKTFVATKNLGKLGELREIFAGTELDLDTYPLYAEPAEGETSYVENAAIKARALRGQLQQAGVDGAVLADDSGLEVAALDGRPGVLSSRYQGPDATWPARREALLEEMKDVPEDKRAAKFCCAMLLILSDGSEVKGYGEVRGTIATEEHGKFGFGYDPIFFYPPARKTFAELDNDAKNRVSHRGRAASALLSALRTRG